MPRIVYKWRKGKYLAGVLGGPMEVGDEAYLMQNCLVYPKGPTFKGDWVLAKCKVAAILEEGAGMMGDTVLIEVT